MRFFDRSFRDATLGRAFAADFRYGDIRQRIHWYARAHREKRAPFDFAFLRTGRSMARGHVTTRGNTPNGAGRGYITSKENPSRVPH